MATITFIARLQPYVTSFYQSIGYYMIDHNNDIDTWNIRKQVVENIMFLKRKQRPKLKVKGCTEGSYHWIFKNEIKLSSDLVQSITHESCHMLNTTGYNYKLRSVLDEKMIPQPISGYGLINKYVISFCFHG